MALIKLCVALEPPQQAALQALAQSRELARLGGTELCLDSHTYPHITVFLGYFAQEKLAAIEKVMEDAKSGPIQCIPAGCYARKGYVGIDFVLTEELRNLHAALAPQLTAMQDAAAGWRGAYRPHLTLAKFKSQRVKAPLLRMPPFVSAALTLFEAGKHGGCIRRIRSLSL